MSLLRALGLLVALVATVAWAWNLDHEPADPTANRQAETDVARRTRLEALLEREVQVIAENEPIDSILARLCRAAGVQAEVACSAELRSLVLPHRIPLGSAIGLVAPEASLGFAGSVLQITAGDVVRPGLQLRVHPVHLAPREKREVVEDLAAVTAPTWLETAAHVQFLEEPALQGQWLGESSRLTPPRILLSLEPQHVDPQGDFLTALETAADAQAAEPIWVGESNVRRTRRQRLEQALATPIQLELKDATQRETLGLIQSQLDVNLVVPPWLGPGDMPRLDRRLSFRGRLPAASALRMALLDRDEFFVPEIRHDVIVLVHTTSRSRTLHVYPIGHLFNPDAAWDLNDLTSAVFDWKGPFRNFDSAGAWAGALAVRQTSDAHDEASRALDLLHASRSVSRVVACAADRLAGLRAPILTQLDRAAQPWPGPLTLSELADQLARDLGTCVYVDEPALVRLRQPDPSRPPKTLMLAGDAGQGSRAQQLERMLERLGCVFDVEEHALRITTAGWQKRDAWLEMHPLPENTLTYLPRGAYALTENALADEVLGRGTDFRSRTPGGLLLNSSVDKHALLHRVLSAGRPFHDTLAAWLTGPRRARKELTLRALASDDPHTAALGGWLVDTFFRPSSFQPPLTQTLRSGVLLRSELSSTPRAAVGVWSMLINVLPAAEYMAILRELEGRPVNHQAFLHLLERAIKHPDVDVARLAYEILERLPARPESDGGEWEVDLDELTTTKPALRGAERAAIDAHLCYGAARRSDFVAVGWLLESLVYTPTAHDVLRSRLARYQPTGDYVGTLVQTYEEMLDDDIPEHRQAACRALFTLTNPPPELVERLRLQLFDPETADLARPQLDAWRRAGIFPLATEAAP